MKNKLYIYNRPIAPHLTIYFPQISSIFSIWHRLTSILLLILLISLLIISKGLINPFFLIFLTFNKSLIDLFNFFYLITVFIFIYHALNGIRHITWDLGFLLNIKEFNLSGLFFILFLFIILFQNF
uniref:Succinate:cytochrome c oxidoreductase subunit 3 n=1 Tax=Schimmelmannia schousboei TaxID=173468 RepID=A0A0E3DBC9_9FLOR|nr:succinate:cytochrome c oxidoreductase subunit 3 [Schimmelmannia schousboei]